MDKKTLTKGDICPVCLSRIDSITIREKGKYKRQYVYAIHFYKGGDGKRHRYECYLGPANEYVVAEKTNNIGLKGRLEKDRFVEYLESILTYYKISKEIDTGKALELFDKFMELLTKVAVSEDDKKKVKEVLQGWIDKLK